MPSALHRHGDALLLQIRSNLDPHDKFSTEEISRCLEDAKLAHVRRRPVATTLRARARLPFDGHTSCRLCAKHDARFRRRNAERSFVTKRLPVYSVPRAEGNSADDNPKQRNDVQVIGDVGAAVSIKAANWSLGERQIICLARCE